MVEFKESGGNASNEKGTQMKVTLKHSTPLHIASGAARTCWDSGDKSDTVEDVDGNTVCGEKDRTLIERVGNKFKHASILEHIVFTFFISGVSRALLQELARHRIASPSVKSTRYTLTKLKNEKPFVPISHVANKGMFCGVPDVKRAEKYIVLTGNELVDNVSILSLEGIRGCLELGISNDISKYCLPESFKTELTWTINARSLQNFLHLRTDKAALWEIRELANTIYDTIPETHKYLFVDSLWKPKDPDEIVVTMNKRQYGAYMDMTMQEGMR